MKKGNKLFINAKIYSMDENNNRYSAMLTKNGIIKQLYKEKPDFIEYKNTSIIDCAGKTIIPGFTDSHCHFLTSSILSVIGISISKIENSYVYPRNLNEFRDKLIKEAKNKPTNKPLVC